jgi:phosphatidylglycerol:prolipoprotein diacylglycerol transferase
MELNLVNPVFFEIGQLTIHWYGVFMALGFLAGLVNWILLSKRKGCDFAYSSDLLFWIMVSGVLGARIAYVISDFRNFAAEPVTILFIHRGGLIYYGGFVAAIVAIIFFSRLRGEPVWSVLDFAATSLPLAHAFGRVGCFLNGCCYGSEYNGPFAVTYPTHGPIWWQQVNAGRIMKYTADRSLPLHPVQLYEATMNLLLYVVLLYVYRRRKRDGTVAAVYLLTYSVIRFCMEFFRGDPRMIWQGLTYAQLVSIGLFATGLALLAWKRGSNGVRE